MTREDKQLLLKDLSARLPYGVVLSTPTGNKPLLALVSSKKYNTIIEYDDYCGNENDISEWSGGDIEFIKPYLRPMSSMTEEEKKDLLMTVVGSEGAKHFQVMPDGGIDNTDAITQDLNKFNIHWVNFNKDNVALYLDWLLSHHFDYRGLIERGLAIKVSENNPYN